MNSSSTLILFIASVLVAAGVATTLALNVGKINSAVSERGQDVSQDIRTEIEIISQPGSNAIYNNTTNDTTLLVKNTGSSTMPVTTSKLTLLTNGRYTNISNVTLVDADGATWRSGTVIRVNASKNLARNEEHSLTIIAGGSQDTLKFYNE